MGMDSILEVNGEVKDNSKNSAKFKETFKRQKNGKFKPINIFCSYEEGYGEQDLNIVLKDFNKCYTFTMAKDDTVDDRITFY